MTELRLGELEPLDNIFVEFGENKTGYFGGYLRIEGQLVPIILTRKEIERAATRAERESENFDGVTFVVKEPWINRLLGLFGIGE